MLLYIHDMYIYIYMISIYTYTWYVYIYMWHAYIYIYILICCTYIPMKVVVFVFLRENEGVPQEGPDLCPGESAQTVSKKRCTETSPESFNQKQQAKQQTCICTKKLFQHVLTCTIPKRYSSSLQQDISLNSNSSQSWTPSMKVLGGLGCANM